MVLLYPPAFPLNFAFCTSSSLTISQHNTHRQQSLVSEFYAVKSNRNQRHHPSRDFTVSLLSRSGGARFANDSLPLMQTALVEMRQTVIKHVA